MAKYDQLVKDILENIGGKENIISVTHCVTRLRFNLKDESIANDDVLKNMDGIVTVMKTAGQYQVVIGNHVPDVYAELIKQTGITDDNRVETDTKMSLVDKGIDILSGIMMPSIMLLCAAGVIKGMLALVVAFNLMDASGSWYTLFYAIGDAMFYFLPIILGYNAAKKFNMNPYIGLMLGAILCYPTINGQELTFFNQTLTLTYTSTVLPIIFICGIAAPLERFLNKVIPDVVKTFMVPTIVLCIMAPIGFLLIGPISNMISAQLGVLINSIYGISPLMAGLILGFFYQMMVILGVHLVLTLPSMISLFSGNPDPVLPLMLAPSFAQTGMVFAIWLKTKDKKLKAIAFPAWVSGVFGVTEPAIYGVTLPRKKYFMITCAVAGLASGIIGLSGSKMYQMAGMGIFAFPAYVDPTGADMQSFYIITLSALGALVLAAIIGLIVYKDEVEDENLEIPVVNDQQCKSDTIFSPIVGTVKPLSMVEDAAFAEGLLGQGVAIEPQEGSVYAPFDGTVVSLFPTKHAIGLVSDNGCEVLIHVGMDTVKLDGKYFESFVEQGMRVTKGDKLVTFDIQAIKDEGYSIITPVIVTNTSDYLDVIPATSNSSVEVNTEIIKVVI